jgi:hypothetical protein
VKILPKLQEVKDALESIGCTVTFIPEQTIAHITGSNGIQLGCIKQETDNTVSIDFHVPGKLEELNKVLQNTSV